MRTFLFFLIAQMLHAEATICLNMIVKNESAVIEKCLASAKPLIDYWVIVDTGSTDGTQEIIREFMKDLPGELYERPWVDFSHNRNEALALAKHKADYSLFLDADQTLESTGPLPPLDKDYYIMEIHQTNGVCCPYRSLVKNRLNWQWTGVLHEYIDSPQAKSFEVIEAVSVQSDIIHGHRSQDPQKYLKDAQILEQALAKDPTNDRHMLYLGLSYANGGEYASALKYFTKRASIDKYPEEVFFAKFAIARMLDLLDNSSDLIVQSYREAYDYCPKRIEPMYYLANHYIRHQNYAQGYETLKPVISISSWTGGLFLERWMYDWGALQDYILCCFHMKKYREMEQMMQMLLKRPNLPPHIKKETEENLAKIKGQRDRNIRRMEF